VSKAVYVEAIDYVADLKEQELADKLVEMVFKSLIQEQMPNNYIEGEKYIVDKMVECASGKAMNTQVVELYSEAVE
jgi:hypothetical protein